MKTSTAFNHRTRAEQAIRELWTSARIFSQPHSELLERKIAIFATVAHCPTWVKSYLEGYYRCLMDMNYQNLEFCYNLRGVLYSTHRDSDKPGTDRLYKKNLGAYISRHKGAHYWKGTDKQF